MSVRTAIAGVGSPLPDHVVTTADINRRIYNRTGLEIHNGLVERLTGVRTRRYRADGEQSSDLAVRAARQALERADISINEIDLIIFSACTQDITEPATANIVQEKLGAKNAQVMDVGTFDHLTPIRQSRGPTAARIGGTTATGSQRLRRPPRRTHTLAPLVIEEAGVRIEMKALCPKRPGTTSRDPVGVWMAEARMMQTDEKLR